MVRSSARWLAGAVLTLGAGLAAAALVSAPVESAPRATACEKLATLAIANTKILRAEAIPAGIFTPPGDMTGSSKPKKIEPIENLPAFCRVVATVSPVPDSEIEIEVWLPATGWNGKLQSIGNHYFAGGIYYEDMAVQLRRGYATSGTSMGHVGTGHFRWAYGHPQKVIDFAWRANHEMAVLAKTLIAAHYGKAPAHSYFNGCSTGGREGLKHAQMFPADYDGIIAGGASSHYTGYNAQLLSIGLALSGKNNLSNAQVKAVEKDILARCDAKDGVTDGLLGDPRLCKWNARDLLCKPGDKSGTCLTKGQASAIESLYRPLRDPVTKKDVFPGIAYGSEYEIVARYLNKGGPHEAPLMLYAFALGLPEYDAKNFNLHTDMAKFDEGIGKQMSAIDPDLSAFLARGGKLIEYKGWGDAIANPFWTIEYYEQVRKKFGAEKTAEFYRLFLMPSLAHCTDGAGPNTIGGLGQPTPPSIDAEHDLVSALEAWVEKGIAPTQIVATKYAGDDPAKGITMQRPVCAYPAVAKYKGSGDTNKAENFTCAK